MTNSLNIFTFLADGHTIKRVVDLVNMEAGLYYLDNHALIPEAVINQVLVSAIDGMVSENKAMWRDVGWAKTERLQQLTLLPESRYRLN